MSRHIPQQIIKRLQYVLCNDLDVILFSPQNISETIPIPHPLDAFDVSILRAFSASSLVPPLFKVRPLPLPLYHLLGNVTSAAVDGLVYINLATSRI